MADTLERAVVVDEPSPTMHTVTVPQSPIGAAAASTQSLLPSVTLFRQSSSVPESPTTISSPPLPAPLSERSIDAVNSFTIVRWLHQLRALMVKNFHMLCFQWKTTTLLLLLPLALVLVLAIIRYVQTHTGSSGVTLEPQSNVRTFARCSSQDVFGQSSSSSVACTTLAFAPANDFTIAVLRATSASIGLDYDRDVAEFSTISSLHTTWANNTGTLDVAIAFHAAGEQWLSWGPSLHDLNNAYTLYWNTSSKTATQLRRLALQFALETAIAQYRAQDIAIRYPKDNHSFVSQWQPQPLGADALQLQWVIPPPALTSAPSVSVDGPTTDDNDDLIARVTAPIFTLIVSVYVLVAVQLVSKEKQEKLLASMRMNGLRESAYWLSYFLTFGLLSLVSTLLLVAIGQATDLQLFQYVSFGTLWLTFWIFMLSMIALSLVFAAALSSPMWLNLMAFMLLLTAALSSVFISVLFDPYAIYAMADIARAPRGASSSAPLIIVHFLPWFHHAKIIQDATWNSQVQPTTNYTALALLPAPVPPQVWPTLQVTNLTQLSYSWNEAVNDIRYSTNTQACNQRDYQCCDYTVKQLRLLDPCQSLPSSGTGLGWLTVLTVSYLLIAWWIGQVTDKYGGGKSIWFFLEPRYWRVAKPIDPASLDLLVDGSTHERERRTSAIHRSVRTVKLSKSYEGSTALKELSIVMERGECFALLGSNGAGKSTLINVLTGMIQPTFGHGYICGHSIRADMDRIQKIIGYCSQENLLWRDLTVAQHLRLTAALRGIKHVADVIRDRMELVGLLAHQHKRASELSGGMMRRLMIAIALVGQPAVVFLDEPTTGMDPLHRHEVWEAIRAVKRQSVVCLTTHNMEEADALGDTIALLSGGRLRALGSSLFLKNHYGKGYQLRLAIDTRHNDALTTAIQKYLPGAEVVARDAGAFTIAFKRGSLSMVPHLFEWLKRRSSLASQDDDDSAESRSIIREWSLSQSSLEEIFLRLCTAETTVNAAVESQSSTLAVRSTSSALSHCILCHVRPVAASVQVLDQLGNPIVLPGTLCTACASGREEQTPLLASEEEKELSETRPPLHNSSDRSEQPCKRDILRFAQPDRPPRLFDQMAAIFWKNRALINLERKAWILRVVTVIVLVAIIAILPFVGVVQPPQTDCIIPKQAKCTSDQIVTFLFGDSMKDSDYQYLDQPVSAADSQLFYTSLWSFDSSKSNLTLAFSDPSTLAFSLSRFDIINNQLNATTNLTLSSRAYWTNWTNEIDQSQSVNERVQHNARYMMTQIAASNSTPMNSCPWGFNYLPYVNRSWVLSMDEFEQINRFFLPDYIIEVLESEQDSPLNARMSYRLSSLHCGSNSMPVMIGANQPVDYASCTLDSAPCFNYHPYDYVAIVHSLSNALLRTSIRVHSSYVGPLSTGFLNASSPSILARIREIPRVSFSPASASTIYAYTMGVVTLMSLFLIPWIADRLLLEREEGLLSALRMSGMRASSYWLGNYTFDLIIGWVWSALLLAVGYGSKTEVFVHSDVACWIILFLVWNHCMIGLAWLAAALFSRRRVCAILLYLLVILLTAAAVIWDLLLPSGFQLPLTASVAPPVAFIRVASYLVRYGGSVTSVYHSDISLSLIVCALVGTGLMMLAVLLHSAHHQSVGSMLTSMMSALMSMILGETDGQAASSEASLIEMPHNQPLPLEWDVVSKRWTASPRGSYSAGLGSPVSGSETEDSVERKDVMAERARVLSSNSSLAVAIVNLSKSYITLTAWMKNVIKYSRSSSQRLAVNQLFLGLNSKETLGLLGPNGAGTVRTLQELGSNINISKSTTLSILSGALSPSKGKCLIGGYNVSSQLAHVYTMLGVCGQHDVFYPELTVQQHLLLFARVRGVSGGFEYPLSQRIAELVNLDGDAFWQPADSLSGGMKRRLSLAISLIGNPKVWMLDEPTTGLSPEARRTVWSIISTQRKYNRSIIITTHSMDEADVLCDRIAIICSGRLQCIGSQASLKERFGDGFKLVLSMTSNKAFDLEEATRFCQQQLQQPCNNIEESVASPSCTMQLLQFIERSVFPGAVFWSCSGRQVQFLLPVTANDSVSQLRSILTVFDRMEASASLLLPRYQIREWSVVQATLEEVFVKIVKQAGSKEDA